MDSTHENLAVVLEGWAREILEDDGEAAFRRQCGDYFVTAITSGAEILAVITFESSDKKTKDALSAGITASYSIASASADIDLDRSSEASSSKLKVSYTQVGGARGEIPTTNEDLKRKLQVLAAEAAEAPIFYEIGIKAYADLPDWPEESDLPGPHDELNSLLSKRDLEMFTLYNTLESVLQNPAAYSIDDSKELFAPRFMVLAAIQDKALKVRQLIAEFQRHRQEHELNILAGRPLGDITQILKTGNTLVRLDLPEIYKATIASDATDYKTNQTNVIKYLRALNVPKMRLWLPLPVQDGTPDNSDYAKKVVEYYIGRQARRVCKRMPVSDDCLDNVQLQDLQYQVLPNYYQLKLRSGVEGYLFTTNQDIKGCLHVTGEYRYTTIQQVAKDDVNLKQAGCTLFSFEAVDAKPSAFHIKADALFLTRAGVRISLAPIETKNVFNQWSVHADNKLGTAAIESPSQCMTAENNRQVGAATCSASLTGWFFVPKIVLPD
jgi:hypothetical protein